MMSWKVFSIANAEASPQAKSMRSSSVVEMRSEGAHHALERIEEGIVVLRKRRVSSGS